MCKKYGAIWALTIFLAVLALWIGRWDRQPEEVALLSARIGETGETVDGWKSEESYYFFLPHYAQLEQLVLSMRNGDICSIAGREAADGKLPGFAECGAAYEITWTEDGMARSGRIIFYQADALPSLCIDVASGTMAYIHAEKGNAESGTMRLYTAAGDEAYAGKLTTIKGRGNSSWSADKKPYSLVLEEEADLLGMGKAQNWVLMSNAMDKSHLRNKIVYDFAAEMGLEYSPQTRWVDLYLNGEYAGLYLLTERNEVHENRVALGERGFLVSQEMEKRLRTQNLRHFLTDAGPALRIHSDTLDPGEMEQIWQSAENAILATDGTDPETGKHWQEWIDTDSWVRKYLIDEVFGNIDGGAFSQYYYYDEDRGTGMIYAGPVWDYDLSMGNDTIWQQTKENRFYTNRAQVTGEIAAPWYSALCDKPEFAARVTETYKTEMLPMLEELMDTGLERYWEQIARSAEMDRIRWNYQEDSFSEMQETIRAYMRQRMAFLEDIWLAEREYHVVQVKMGEDDAYAYYVLPAGSCIRALPEMASSASRQFLGWYYADTGEPVSLTRPVTADTVICGRFGQSLAYRVIYYGLPAAGLVMLVVLMAIDFSGRRGKNCGRR